MKERKDKNKLSICRDADFKRNVWLKKIKEHIVIHLIDKVSAYICSFTLIRPR